MGKDNLTPKQQRFIQEYLIDLNATQAAIRAGYSAKNADKIGSQQLGKTRVRFL
jgi:phage terminase small subunit